MLFKLSHKLCALPQLKAAKSYKNILKVQVAI